MEYLFVSIYDFFQKRPRFLVVVFIALTGLSLFFATRIQIRENISDIFPDDKKIGEFNQVFQSKALEKLVFMVSLKDSLRTSPDSLVIFADSLVATIQAQCSLYVESIKYQVDDEQSLTYFNTLSDHLPIFLTDDDYHKLDLLLDSTNLRQRIHENYRQLISPSGIIAKRIYSKDILGITQLGLSKIQQLQYDDNYVLYNSCLFTRDLKHLVFFVVPKYSSNETGKNIVFIDQLNNVIKENNNQNPEIDAMYFGGVAVAVANASQIRFDTNLTLGIMIVLLIVFVFWFFKRKRAPLVVFIPVVFGVIFSLACIAIIKGSVSVLALAAGSIILGVAVNYSLHFIVHMQHLGNARDTVKDLANPLTLGSATTVLAFFGLQFANAGILRDIGLFAGISLIGAAFCSLIFLPHFFKSALFQANESAVRSLNSFLSFEPSKKKWVIVLIALLTPVFFYMAQSVTFNSDMNKLNFMSPELIDAQQKLNVINEFSLQSVYVIASGKNEQEALRNSERAGEILHEAKQKDIAEKYLSPSLLLISDSLQKIRIQKWNNYWTADRKQKIRSVLKQEGERLKFSNTAYAAFDQFIDFKYEQADRDKLSVLKSGLFSENFVQTNDHVAIIIPAMIKPEHKKKFYQSIENHSSINALDKQSLTASFIDSVNADFTFIVMFTSILVFTALLLAYGRIELAMITFIPMFVTWIWILGIMALFKIEFNIVNVMVSTFIFGLGDDYSIFTMDGLQQQHKTGRKNLSSVRLSILISAITTIIGLGVLLFAKHPALQSIALIAITGIVCVFIMSQTLEPFLFHVFISGRAKRGMAPYTMLGLIRSVLSFSIFATGSIVLAIIGIVILKVNPFFKRTSRHIYHTLLSALSRMIMYMNVNLKKRIIHANGAFDKPSIIISNHASFIDILITTMLSPKVILLTNKWVWNSPVFGAVVRLGEYYPVMEGAEDAIDKLQKKVDQGFSILVFPEGTRSPDGKVKRFHKGAFYLAEKLNIPIRPLLLHGTHECIVKGDFYVNDAFITLKFLPPVKPDNTSFGVTYSERTKSVSKYFKKEFSSLADEMETPAFFYYKLMRNYYYKGPVLEWYARIKLKLENNYEKFNQLVPEKANILDLGCGYGFMSYMLHFLSSERTITGVDYDELKIDTANNCYSKSDKLSFYCEDVMKFPVNGYDVIIISDVLHYLASEQQVELLKKCFSGINPGGRIIIRDGNIDMKKKHRWTELTEFFSTKLFRFNKSVQKLNFLSGETIKNEASRYNLSVEVSNDSKLTSNVIFVIKSA